MGYFPVTLDGVGYMVDLAGYVSSTLETIRQQADDSEELGERSLNPADLWRRSADSWKLGAGQNWFDLRTRRSNRERFKESVGISPWDEGNLELLYDVYEVGVSGPAPNSTEPCNMVTTSDRIFVLGQGDTTLFHRTDVEDTGSWDSETLPDSAVGHSMTSDGRKVYLLTDQGIYETEDGSTITLINDINASSPPNPGVIGFVKGRLMVGVGTTLYNITDTTSTATPENLTDGSVLNGDWLCFGEGDSHIYCGFQQGRASYVYRISIREDGTALASPTQAAQLPDGEYVLSIQSYVGVVILGTSKGVRLAVSGANGDLSYGPLVETPGPVHALAPHEQFVWFGYGDTSSTRAGLGRIDLREFTDSLTPAYATDVMATVSSSGQPVWSAVWFDETLTFLINDTGVFAQSDDRVSTGNINSGRITFDLADNKVFERLLIKTEPMPAGSSIGVEILVDGTSVMDETYSTGDFATGGTGGEILIRDGNGDPPVGQYAQLILTLNRATDTTESPVISRWTMRANPIPRRGTEWILPVVLADEVTDLNGQKVHYDPATEVARLRQIAEDGEPVSFTEFGTTRSVYVDRVQWGGSQTDLYYNPARDDLQGVCYLQLRSFA